MKSSTIFPTNDVDRDNSSDKYACNKMPMIAFNQLPVQSQYAPGLVGNLGNSWSTEISTLSNCRSSYEAAVCLRRIQNLLNDINRDDRIKFCKGDFEVSIEVLRAQSQNSFLWTSDVRSIVLSIYSTYFNESYLHNLSVDLLQEILMWIAIDEFLPILCISHDWYHIGTSNKIWKLFYQHRFVRLNPKSNLPPSFNGKYIQAFQQRLHDPHIGDKVEVAWRGKFRLEASDVYHGLAWWVAEVVDKHTSQHKYKIKYPGWDDRWDEWVPRSRLRWQVESNEVVQITVDSAVEIWCCGATVPGAWLESKVTQISYTQTLIAPTPSTTNGTNMGNMESNTGMTHNELVMYCVGGVLSSGELWVPRDRLRLIKHENQFDESRVDLQLSPRSSHRGDSFVSNHNTNGTGGTGIGDVPAMDGHNTPNGGSILPSSLLHRWSSSPSSSLRSSFIGLTFRSMSIAGSASTSPTQTLRTPRSPPVTPRTSQNTAPALSQSQNTWRTSNSTESNTLSHTYHTTANVTQPIPPFMQTISVSAAVAAAAVVNTSISNSNRTTSPRSPHSRTQQENVDASCIIM